MVRLKEHQPYFPPLEQNRLKQLRNPSGQIGRLTAPGIRYIIQKVGEEAGVRLPPHQLRHTLALVAFQSVAPAAIVSRLLRGRSIKTTVDIYSIFELSRLEFSSPVTQVREDFRHALF